MICAGVVTAGSHSADVEDGGRRAAEDPENIEVIMTIRKTAKVMPTSSAGNFPWSCTNSLWTVLRIPFTEAFLFASTRNKPLKPINLI